MGLNITEALKTDIENYCKNVAKNMAIKISDDLTEEAKSAIDDFYSDYSPIYYKRHENFLKSYRRDYRNHGDHFSAGVELLINTLPDVYSDPTDEVFMRVYYGFHGYASIFDNNIYDVIDRNTNLPTGAIAQHTRFVPPTMKPSPMERLLDKRNEIIENISKYQNNASTIAKQSKYKYLKF